MSLRGRQRALWRWAWGAALAVQASLLFWRIELLPVWGDEQFTLDVVALGWAEIPAVLQRDIHPPLYYFLAKAWAELPFPGELIVRLRALSAFFVLATTGLLAYRRRDSVDWILPALCAVAPVLILYGRIGRSYSLQLFLATALIFAAIRFLERRTARRTAAFCALSVALLYVHYLPGVAIPAAVSIVYLWGRRRPAKPLIVSWIVIALAYLPWAWTLLDGIGRVAGSMAYWFGSSAVDLILRVGYLYASFHFGEALPGWGLALGLIVGLALLWIYSKGPKPEWAALVLAAAGIAFVVAAQWVSFAFMPGRLLFLHAFFLLFVAGSLGRAGRAGKALLVLMLAVQVLGLGAYFGKSGFFNKAYVIPFDEMARTVLNDQDRSQGAVVVDYFNADPKPLIAKLTGRTELVIVGPDRPMPAQSDLARFEPLWIARSTNDLSPSGSLGALEEALMADRECTSFDYVAYNAFERWALNKVGRKQKHHYRLVRCGAAK